MESHYLKDPNTECTPHDLLSTSKIVPVELERPITTKESGLFRKTVNVSAGSARLSAIVGTIRHTSRVVLVSMAVRIPAT